MASAVNFRMHHGSESSCVNFVGNSIKVLELKREILDRKKFSGSSDFDLKIVDESGKGNYIECLINDCNSNPVGVVVPKTRPTLTDT